MGDKKKIILFVYGLVWSSSSLECPGLVLLVLFYFFLLFLAAMWSQKQSWNLEPSMVEDVDLFEHPMCDSPINRFL